MKNIEYVANNEIDLLEKYVSFESSLPVHNTIHGTIHLYHLKSHTYCIKLVIYYSAEEIAR